MKSFQGKSFINSKNGNRDTDITEDKLNFDLEGW
jgi:hypothetical protein